MQSMSACKQPPSAQITSVVIPQSSWYSVHIPEKLRDTRDRNYYPPWHVYLKNACSTERVSSWNIQGGFSFYARNFSCTKCTLWSGRVSWTPLNGVGRVISVHLQVEKCNAMCGFVTLVLRWLYDTHIDRLAAFQEAELIFAPLNGEKSTFHCTCAQAPIHWGAADIQHLLRVDGLLNDFSNFKGLSFWKKL